MAQIGYGSEFQLMRFLGHHRNLLENEIKKQIGVEGEIRLSRNLVGIGI